MPAGEGAAPPGGCSCVNHLCVRGVLTQGQACIPTQDACGSGLKCCANCPAGTVCFAGPVCTQAAPAASTGVWSCPAPTTGP